jgi:ribonuclease P protein component
MKKKEETLRNSREFRVVYDGGKSFANKYLVLFFKENGLTYNRVGFVTTKKLGNSVVRNKFKRRLKEAYRAQKTKFKTGYDIVLLSRAGASDIDYRQVDSALRHIMKISNLTVKGR